MPTKRPRGDSGGYRAVEQDASHTSNADDGEPGSPVNPEPHRPVGHERRTTILVLAGCVLLLFASNVYLSLPYAFPSRHHRDECAPEKVPQYFQTSPQLWAGPTATGKPAFLAQTRLIDPTATFVPNEPLQTAIPIQGMQEGNRSIFQMMGYLSPYAPSPGFGVDEYPIPDGAEIVQVQMLSRHGARYPTTGTGVERLGHRLAELAGKVEFHHSLKFLNDWKYALGLEILVPRGRQELYNSGKTGSHRSISAWIIVLTSSKVCCIAICMEACTTPPAKLLFAPRLVGLRLFVCACSLTLGFTDTGPHAQVSGKLACWVLRPGVVNILISYVAMLIYLRGAQDKKRND